MELIKKNFQTIISYGLIIVGIILLCVIVILHPTRIILKETTRYAAEPSLETVNFPFTQTIIIPEEKLSFIELRFGDDSIKQCNYNITATNNSETIFNHEYINNYSNIVRIPIDYSTTTLTPNNHIDIKITPKNSCNDIKFEQFNIDNQKIIKALYGFQKTDFGLIWYGLFPVAMGLTLLPLTKRGKKNA